MSSGNSDPLLQFVNRYRCITIVAACAGLGLSPNSAVKKLARLTDRRKIRKAPYIPPRAYWHTGHPLGAQGLILASSVLYRCVLAEPRIWTPLTREGPATIIACDSEREALFVDYGATPRSVARKLGRWCEGRDTSDLTALGIVVPTEAKAHAINGAVHDLPLPVRYTVSEDLWSLSCTKARR